MTVHVNWREDVACRDADPDLFFPIGMTGAALLQMEQAKRICRACPGQRQPLRQMAMTRVITQQGAENMAYVRRLLRERQPGFSAALELALMLAELELTSSEMPGQMGAFEGS